MERTRPKVLVGRRNGAKQGEEEREEGRKGPPAITLDPIGLYTICLPPR
jgi:hypothetical protein